jgi:hypothetical protein
MAEFFGCDDYDVFCEMRDAKETSEGYLAGTIAAARIQEEILDEFKNRSRVFREAVLKGLREQL